MDVTESGNYRQKELQRLYMRRWRAKKRAAAAAKAEAAGIVVEKKEPSPPRPRKEPRPDGSLTYYERNKTSIQIRTRAHRHGLHPEWVTNALFSQNYRCAIRAVEFSDDAPFTIDHDHDTDEIRQLLCRYCNIGVGWAERPQMPAWLAYVERHKKPSLLN